MIISAFYHSVIFGVADIYFPKSQFELLLKDNFMDIKTQIITFSRIGVRSQE
jgi:hypothetical protein